MLLLADGRLVGEIVEPTTESVLDALREIGAGRTAAPAADERVLVAGGLR